MLRAAAAESTGPEPRRLCLVAVGEWVPPGTLPLFRKLRRYGTYYGAVDTTGAWPAAVQAVAQRAEAGPAPFAHWYVDGGVATRTSSAVSALSWAQVKPLRLLLLGRMQQATATPGGGPETLRSALAELRPAQRRAGLSCGTWADAKRWRSRLSCRRAQKQGSHARWRRFSLRQGRRATSRVSKRRRKDAQAGKQQATSCGNEWAHNSHAE